MTEMTARKLTNAEKQKLADALMSAAANLFEDWEANTTTGYYQSCKGIPADLAAQQMADWLGRLPGKGWDVRLPQPSYLKQEAQR